jgi:hypothetical protein
MTPTGVRTIRANRPATTANHVLRLLGMLLRHAVMLGWRPDDPANRSIFIGREALVELDPQRCD